jgi:hypothetical protein
MTTDETTSHSAKPPKNGGQAAGYSHLTRLSKNDTQVIGYSHSTRLPKGGSQVAGYKRGESCAKSLVMMKYPCSLILYYGMVLMCPSFWR